MATGPEPQSAPTHYQIPEHGMGAQMIRGHEGSSPSIHYCFLNNAAYSCTTVQEW
jgi:hypothetical protein